MRNNYKVEGEIIIIYLDRRDGSVLEAYVDSDDLEKLLLFDIKWCAAWREKTQSYYCHCTNYLGIIDGKYQYEGIYLHKFILDSPSEEYIDHINHNTLDCRRQNLKRVNNGDNLINRSRINKNSTTGARNVSWSKKDEKYLVQLQFNGKNTCFGKFNINEFEQAVNLAGKLRKEIYKERYKYST